MFQGVWKSYEENELTHSAAHHLMAVHELRSRHGYARVSDIAQHLKITKGSVSSAMKHLKERGYVREDHNKFLELTEKGARVVAEIEATRVAFQRFFTHALGMDGDDAEIDACKVEHLVSAETRSRLTHFLAFLYSDEPAALAFLEALRTHTLELGEPLPAEEVFAGAPPARVRDRA
ncbi:MAG: metal-dependent transcriptional regulator [Candidatus Handelsmanbacteria bacterium]|nr:metal-dependent transcriptional regulator [Candidatus Handelsmanbacteria bacterium]